MKRMWVVNGRLWNERDRFYIGVVGVINECGGLVGLETEALE